MKSATPQRRAGRSTRYEVVAQHPAQPAVIVGFTPRVSRRGLLLCMQARCDELVQHCSVTDDDTITWHTQPHVHAKLGRNGWTVGFTGRTERDVLATGNAS